MIDADLNVLLHGDNMRVSSDGLTYLFRLREGVRWSDGEPLTADDFAFTWMWMRELETRTAFLMEDVDGGGARRSHVRDQRCASRAASSLCSRLAVGLPWPRTAASSSVKTWHWPENLVSNGPFTLAEFDDEHALLVANPH